MAEAFVIIQIGDPDLDQLCTDAIFPAIAACGLGPRRVDRHNEGGLLKSEIIRFIQTSDILIAYVTNERPNVYLEIGYAMGIDKFKNLILTVREDHFPDSPNHRRDGAKVHFDLAGYDILRWTPGQLDVFRAELERRIRRRLAIVGPRSAELQPIWDENWIGAERDIAMTGLVEIGRTGFMEVRFALHPPKVLKTLAELNDAAQHAPIETFGWPIAVYLSRDEFRPRPRADGIVATVRPDVSKQSFDHWAIHRNGDFYFLGSLFEDERRPGQIFFDTRIVRTTEAILYCTRLYSRLGIDRSATVSIAVCHGGLRGRTVSCAGGRYVRPRTTSEDRVETVLTSTLDELEGQLVDKVMALTSPMFQVYDFFDVGRPIYEELVNKFVADRVV